MTQRKVLFVDDEVNVVEGIKRQVRKSFDVFTATDPREALELVKRTPDFAVIVSDMRMPQMSGVEFLSAVKKIAPDSVRIMLTGNQDQLTAAAAVNQGEVFKFLCKPCDAAELTNVLDQGLRQYQLLTLERDLLNRTLQGSIKMLIEALSIAKPDLFGSSDRIERSCSQVAQGMEGVEEWEMRTAARLCRLGCLGMSGQILEKIRAGTELTERQRLDFEGHAQIGARLIGEIPRLERVAEAVLYQNKNFDGSGVPRDGRRGKDIPVAARILRIVLALDDLQMRGFGDAAAFKTMRGQAGCFDPDILERMVLETPEEPKEVFRVAADKLYRGLIIAEDVHSSKGILLVGRGQEVTSAVQRHLKNFFDMGALTELVLVSAAATAAAAATPAR